MLHFFKFRQDLFDPTPAKDVYVKRPTGRGWPEECPPIRAANSFGYDILANFDIAFTRKRDGTWKVEPDVIIESDFNWSDDDESDGAPLNQQYAWFWDKGQTLPHKIDRLLTHHNALRRGLSLPEVDANALLKDLTALGPQVLPFADSVWNLLDHKRREGKRILFEGAQGALLDIDHGTYPYVTSSNTVAAQAATGTGMGPSALGYVLGICKAYTTRVGMGPFPTELTDATGELIGQRGREFGVNTGRKRRCGWFDAMLVRQTVRTCGIHGLALTKLDILDGFEEIKVCVGYELDGKEIDHLPAGEGAQARVKPIYETIEGWQEPTANARSWADLPAQAIKYVRRVEELVGCSIALLSTSPEREDTILVQNPFEA